MKKSKKAFKSSLFSGHTGKVVIDGMRTPIFRL